MYPLDAPPAHPKVSFHFADVSPPSELASGSKGRVRCINKQMLYAVCPLGCFRNDF
jgi:hypothetical protein